MFKNMIGPVQAWLLSQKRCVGCGTDLTKGKVSANPKQNGEILVTCKCGRVFVHETKIGQYRRALLSET